MEELITKYLTDSLCEAEEERFRALMCTDESFRREFARSLATLAIVDYSLENANEGDVAERLEELMRQ